MSHLQLVKGDSRTVMSVAVTREDTGEPANISGSTTTLNIREAGSTTTLFSVVGELLTGYVDADGNITTGPYTTLGSGGRVQFQFPVGALNIDAGLYEGQIVVAYGASTQTVYDLIQLLVRE